MGYERKGTVKVGGVECRLEHEKRDGAHCWRLVGPAGICVALCNPPGWVSQVDASLTDRMRDKAAGLIDFVVACVKERSLSARPVPVPESGAGPTKISFPLVGDTEKEVPQH
jgi:hypothetical protein